MGSSLAEVVFWGQCFSQGTDIGSLQCLQKVEAWQSPTRFNVIQRAKIKQYVFCLVVFLALVPSCILLLWPSVLGWNM